MTAIADHLWQSTLVGVVALLLALALKHAPPRFRYGIWLAASVKFLIPIALLMSLGGYFKLDTPAPVEAQAVAAAVTTVSHPFSELGSVSHPLTLSPSHPLQQTSAFPVFLLSVWVSGSLLILLVRVRNWRRISSAVRASHETTSGRALELLRDVERALGVRRATTMRCSDGVFEPAVVGFFRPVLIWPSALTGRLSDAEMTSIFAHELTHLRRRDNLTALLHMAVETIFWFHPMTWWISGRLVEERERACDQSVLAAGSEPKTYAEGLLTVCRMCLESPVRCAAGVTGAGLVRRVERIMSGDRSRRLRWVERVLLAATGVILVSVPVAAGMFRPGPSVTLATIVSPAATTLQIPAPPETVVLPPASMAQPEPPSSVITVALLDFLGSVPFTTHTALQAPAQPTLPVDPESPKIARGDLIRIDRGPSNPWSMTVSAEGEVALPGLGPIAFEGLTAKQVEYLVRLRLAENKLISATDLITVTVRYLSRVAGTPTSTPSGTVADPVRYVLAATVFVAGAVRTAGDVQLPDFQMTLMKAINKAGGWAAEAGAEVYLLRPSMGQVGVMTLDNPRIALKERYLRKDLAQARVDPPLQAGDTIFVTTAEMFWINGEVRAAGQKIFEDGMTVADALSLAGGLTANASLGRSYITRRNARGTYDRINNLKNETPILPRDTLNIGRKLFSQRLP